MTDPENNNENTSPQNKIPEQNGAGGDTTILTTRQGHGTDTSLTESRGFTALDLAVQNGNVEAIEIMEEFVKS